MSTKDKLNLLIKVLFLALFAVLVFNWVSCKNSGSCESKEWSCDTKYEHSEDHDGHDHHDH